MHLAHLGAEVIKVESRQAPDLGRRLPIFNQSRGVRRQQWLLQSVGPWKKASLWISPPLKAKRWLKRSW